MIGIEEVVVFANKYKAMVEAMDAELGKLKVENAALILERDNLRNKNGNN